MPRLLLITFHYPPRPTIGSLRPGALAKYLPQFGWDVVVVTPRFIALAAPDLENGLPWIDKTFEILAYALAEMGIGAKTSSGYGRMSLEPVTKKWRGTIDE